ncbi:protein of unknown function [Paraburkholderia kururiensis]
MTISPRNSRAVKCFFVKLAFNYHERQFVRYFFVDQRSFSGKYEIASRESRCYGTGNPRQLVKEKLIIMRLGIFSVLSILC